MDAPADTDTDADAAALAARVMVRAHKMALEDRAIEIGRYGHLEPCTTLDPLEPPLTLPEYAMMERDRAKYLLYYMAIRQAVHDWAAAAMPTDPTATNHTTSGTTGQGADCDPSPSPGPGTSGSALLRAVVVGPGLGRLVKYIVEAADEAGVGLQVLCIEANLLAVKHVRYLFRGDSRVVVEHFALHPTHDAAALPAAARPFLGCTALSVSELLGCFGDNEFLPELSQTVARLFLPRAGRGGVMIPETWVNYVAPVWAPQLHAKLRDPHATHLVGGDVAATAAGPAAGAADPAMAAGRIVTLAPVTEIYRGSCRIAAPLYSGTTVFDFGPEAAPPPAKRLKGDNAGPPAAAECHGLLGFFTADLYRGMYQLDTRQGSPTYNSFHWEAFFFPAGAEPTQPTCTANGRQRLRATVKRRVAREDGDAVYRLYYEWGTSWGDAAGGVDPDANMDVVMNVDGAVDSVRLRRDT